MNRRIRSRLKGLVVILTLTLFVIGCSPCSVCVLSCLNEHPSVEECIFVCAMFGCPFPFAFSADKPDQCAASAEYYLSAATRFCEENPDVCAELFDNGQESSGTEEQ